MATTITVKRGRAWSKRFTITQGGVAKDITGAAVRFVVREAYPAGTVLNDASAIILKSVGSGVTLTTPGSGILDVEGTEADTQAIEFDAPSSRKVLVFEVAITLQGETDPRDIEDGSGPFVVTADVVRGL